MKKIKEISITDYKPLSSAMINRHYYFQINISYGDYSDNIINKRYSEIEELYKILILKYPGCRIPKFPKKNFSMNIHIAEKDKKELISKIEKFLNHIISHKILCEKDIVNEFFSDKKINKNHTLKTDMMKISEDDVNDSNINDDFDKSDNNKDICNDFEILELKDQSDYKIWYENDSLNDVLNMFLEEKNKEKKGIINKTKGIITSTYNYLISYYWQEDNNINNGIPENNLNNSYYQEENLKTIEKLSNELGEDNNVNKYEKQIMKFNEGLSYLLKNFTNLKNINESKLKSLKNLQNICDDYIKSNYNKKNDEIKIEQNEKWNRKIFQNQINNKLESYISINNKFFENEFEGDLDKISEDKLVVEELKEIYERKKSHINFLAKLDYKLNEIKKEKESLPSDEKIKKDYNFIKKCLDIEKNFIKKLNEDLKFEINFFKDNTETNIYKYLNKLYLNNYKAQIQIFNKLNEGISFESDSENSSKEDSFENMNSFSDKNNEEKNKGKKERNNSIKSDDDF